MSRYIDKETMRGIIREQEKSHGIRGLAWIEMAMDKQEDADVQEVRHGHWIPEKDIERFGIWDTFICSKCCHRTLTECNYCSCCGAKMDEEEQK